LQFVPCSFRFIFINKIRHFLTPFLSSFRVRSASYLVLSITYRKRPPTKLSFSTLLHPLRPARVSADVAYPTAAPAFGRHRFRDCTTDFTTPSSFLSAAFSWGIVPAGRARILTFKPSGPRTLRLPSLHRQFRETNCMLSAPSAFVKQNRHLSALGRSPALRSDSAGRATGPKESHSRLDWPCQAI